MVSSGETRATSVVPAPWALAGLAAVGAVAVVGLPSLAGVLPRGADPEPNAAQFAVTALGMVLLTAGYLAVVVWTTGLSKAWAALALAYNFGIVVAKFILSPRSFRNTTGTTLSQFLVVGLVIMVFYGAALWAISAVALRHRHPRAWPWTSKALVVAGVLAFAMASRYLAVLAIGTRTAEYLRRVFGGSGLFLPVVVVVAAILAVESFDQAPAPREAGEDGAAVRASLRIGLALVLVYHGLWALYMNRLFS